MPCRIQKPRQTIPILADQDTLVSLKPTILRVPDPKAAVDKEWEKLEKMLAWQVTKVPSKKRGNSKGTEMEKDISLCDIDGPVPPQELGARAQIPRNTKVALNSEISPNQVFRQSIPHTIQILP